MNTSPHGGGRGMSLLGLLTVALVFSTGAVVTFELATPSLSSTSETSQVAASVMTAAQLKQAADKKCALLKAGGKETPPVTQNFDVKTAGATNEKDLCVGVLIDSGTRELTCFGKKSSVKVGADGKGTITSVTSQDVPEVGKCVTVFCDSTGKNCSKNVVVSGDRPLLDGAKSPDVYQNLPTEVQKAVNSSLSPSERRILDDAFSTEAAKVNSEAGEAARAASEAAAKREAALNALATCNGEGLLEDCTQFEQQADKAKAEAEAAQKKLADLEVQRQRLAAAKTTLKDPTPSKPPEQKPYAQSGYQQGPPRPQTTFPNTSKPSGGGGGIGDILKGLTGAGQPGAGNTTPRPAGTCPAGQAICSGNTLYSRNNQCVDTPIQYCQYGCAQQTTTGSSGGIFALFGSSQQMSGQCAPAPTQGQQCQPAPTQPDPSNCQNGSWRPTYSGACVSGWQCVPTGSGGGAGAQLAGQLSCQPQIADVGMSIAIAYSCSSGVSSGSGFQTNGALSGTATATLTAPPVNANIATYTLTCSDRGQSISKQCNVQIAKPAIVLISNPKAVNAGESAALGWVTSGMQSCVISSPDLPQFTNQHAGNTSVNGTAQTPPLSTGATFVLKCTTIGGGTREASTAVAIK